MVSQEIVEIILRAHDNASAAIKKAQQNMKNFENTSTKAMGQTTIATDTTRKALFKISNAVQTVKNAMSTINTAINPAFQAIQNAVTSATNKIKSMGNAFLDAHPKINNLAQTIKTQLETAIDNVKSKFKSLSETTTFQILASKVSSASTQIRTSLNNAFNNNGIWNAVMSLAGKVDNALNPMIAKFNRIKMQGSNAFNAIKYVGSTAITSLKSKIDSLSSSFSGLGGIISSAVGGLGMASIGHLTVGLSLSREKMSALNTAIMGSKTSSDALLHSLDNMTNNSVVSMDQMVNALNKIKLSTSMTNEQLDGTKNAVMKLGEASILMGNNTQTAAYQMGEAYSGLNGDFQILKENFGITKEKMQQMGWSGEASDVEGYTKALEGCLAQCGDLGSIMITTAGKIEIVSKKFRTAGRSVGDMLTPYIGMAADAFLKLQSICPGIAQALIIIAGSISIFASVMPSILPVINGFKTLYGVLSITNNISRLNALSTTLMNAAYLVSGTQATALAAAETTLSGALRRAASSAWALTTALLTNPWTWVVIAIVAVVAIMVYLYKTNAQVRNSLNQLGAVLKGGLITAWNAIKSACQAVWQGLVKLGQTIYTHLVPAWNTFKSILAPLVPTFQHLWSVIQRLGAVLTGTRQGTNDASGGFDLLGAICTAIGAIIVGLVDIVAGLVNVLMAFLVPAIQFVVDVISILINFVVSVGEAFSLLSQGDISGFFTTLGQAVVTATKGIIDAIRNTAIQVLANLWAIFGGAITSVSNWLNQLWTTLSLWGTQTITNIGVWFNTLITNIIVWGQQIITNTWIWLVQLVQQAWTAGSQFVTNLINWIMQLPTQVWIWLVNTLTNIYLWVSQLVISAIQAGSQFVNNYINFMRTLPTRVWSWLLNTINRVKTWAIQMKTQAQQTAQGFINRFVSFIKSLPTRAWLYLNYTIQRAKTFKNLIIAVIQQTASRMVQSFCNKIRKLPGEMWNELMRIKDQILRGIGPLGSAIKSLGSNLLKKFKDALGIHSPGHMFYAIYGEMSRIANNLIKNKNTLGKEAKNLGQSMIKGFDKNNFEQMNDIFMQATDNLKMPEIDMNNVQTATQEALVSQKTIFQQQTSTQQQEPVDNTNPLQNTTIQLPATEMNTDATQITNAFTNMATMVNPQLMSIANILNTLSTTSTQNKTTLLQNNTQTLQSLQNLTNTSTLSMQKTIQNNNNTIQSYKTLTNKINTMLQNIQTKNTQGWTHIKTTTQNNLKSMLTSTRSVTSQMVSAWNSMKNSIISAAESIRSQSTHRFNRLWSTIKTFYNRIRNPGGAGPANRASNSRVKRNRATGSIGSTVRNSLNNAIKPRRNRISASKIKPLIPQMDMEYILPFGTSSLPTQDLIKYMTNPNLGAGWNNIIQPNTSWIRKKSNEWKMNGPKVFGKYPTGNNLFKVKEFENGTPRISYGTFKTMAENVFRNIHYDFYWNSEKYGNWRAAAMSGGMNCDDSTEFLMALARACGLSARKVHGHWNNLGHYWAEIEGHKMDTTGFMLGKGWTPSQSHAGPAPSSWKMFESDNTDKSDTIIHGGSIDFNLNINVDTNGNVDSEIIKQGVQVALSDNEILKQIATSSKFQDYDNKTKIRLNRSIERKG